MTGFGVVLIVCHNLFDGVRFSNPVWTMLHVPGVLWSNAQHTIFVAYPLIPWIAVTAAGYGLEQVFRWDANRRRAFL